MPETFIYLASASPRRAALLSQIGIQYERLPVVIDESPKQAEPPGEYVLRMALEKARAAHARLSSDAIAPVLSADTAVVVGDGILGKPADEAGAVAMLGRLSGRAHTVLSAVAVVHDGREMTALSVSTVWFRRLTDVEARTYWAGGEPADKAGAYAIQGIGAIFVERLEGSYSAVMGLPLFETARLLEQCGISLLGGEKGRN